MKMQIIDCIDPARLQTIMSDNKKELNYMQISGIKIHGKTVVIAMLASVVSSLICCAILSYFLIAENRGFDYSKAVKSSVSDDAVSDVGTGEDKKAVSEAGRGADTSPIEALAELAATGDSGLFKQVLHPESLMRLQTCIEESSASEGSFRLLTDVFGNGKSMPDLSMLKGSFGCSYVINDRQNIEGEAFTELLKRYEEQGYSVMPDEARVLLLTVTVHSLFFDNTAKLSPTVVRFGESWYLDITCYCN